MTEEYSYQLKISKSRLGALIGKKGEIKKELEEATHSHIEVDSKEGDITIIGKDTLGLYSAREEIRAIGRGFNPEIAKLLLKQDYVLEIVSIKDFTGKSKNKMMRMKGRVIGTEGKTRRLVEQMTETGISVFGKTISVVGRSDQAMVALRAVESLLSGSPHASVYKWLEKKRREMKRREFEEMHIWKKAQQEGWKGGEGREKNL
ncbi:RNA-processing protein [Candidatus Woesearchaeota archaeon]|nr:RNA-processing protein [Candidatus Woesearchaeota archaeon]